MQKLALFAAAAGAYYLGRKYLFQSKNDKTTVRESIEVEVPVRTAYNQWTQFEEFPKFMRDVREVKQLDEKRLYWRAEIAGVETEWESEITSQQPDKRIAWESTSGVKSAGVVTFAPLSTDRTKITVNMSYDPEGLVESVGDFLGIVQNSLKADVEKFKEFIEGRGQETGAWRGTIRTGHAESNSPDAFKSN